MRWASGQRDEAASRRSRYPGLRTLLETRSFRQTVVVGTVFLVCTAVAVLWTRTLMVDLVKDHVIQLLQRDTETQRLQAGFAAAAPLAEALRRREHQEPETTRQRLVFDARGGLLYGDPVVADRLPVQSACSGGLVRSCDGVPISRHGDGWKMQGLVVSLGDGGRFVNAYDIQPMVEQMQLVPLAAGGGVVVFLLTSLSFGIYFSSAALRRVGIIGEALACYAGGDRNCRIAVGSGADEFDRLGREINRTLDRVNRLVDEVSSVSSSIAHELRTPLTHLHNHLVSIAENCTDERQRRDLEEGIAETRRIQQLFRAIMRLGEIETGRCALAMETLDAVALLNDVRDSCLPLAEESAMTLSVTADPGLRLRGDRALLFQALINLVDNAMKYARQGGDIVLSADIRDGWEELWVSDSGPGLAPGQRALAVQRFCRLDASGTVPGYGLGLAIVRAIATLHGGELQLADNRPGLRAVIRLGHHTDHQPAASEAMGNAEH